MQIFVDADACPVVAIIEKIAKDNSVPVMLLCDTNHVLSSTYSKVVVVGAGADAVDYKLISICHKGDIVVSQDYGVAAMALGKGAYAARNMAQFISENLEKKKREWHKTILKEENIATLKSEKKRLSSRKMKLYSDYRSEVLDKEGYMEELEKTTSRILEITLQIAELENEIAVAKKKCDEATEKEMEVNEIAALQDFDKIQLSKIIEKVFIYEPGRMEISWKMDDIFYKEEKA